MKELVRYFEAYDLNNFVSNVEQIPDEELLSVIQYSIFQKTSHIYSHNKSKRNSRNNFLSEAAANLNQRKYYKTASFIEKILSTANISEEVFDNISTTIENCKISESNPEERLWAAIGRAEKQIDDIISKSEEFIKGQAEKEGGVTIGRRLITNENGNQYDPDIVIEKMVNALSLYISLLAYTNNWHENAAFTFPNPVYVTEEQLFEVGALEMLAVAWKKLEDSANRCMLFGGDVFAKTGCEIQKDAQKAGCKKTYHFAPYISEFEVCDFISSHRVIETNTQSFFSSVLDYDISSAVTSDLSQLSTLNNGKFLSETEISCLASFSHLLCDERALDDEECLGLSIREWVRCFACLVYLAKGFEGSSNNHRYKESELTAILKNFGIDNNKAITFISHAAFGRRSRDLFDSPLIQLKGGDFYLCHKFIKSSSLFFILTSVFSSLEVVFSNKGYNFESDLNDKLKKYEIESKSFKFTRNREEYEFDSVFIMDQRLFIFECKNRSLPVYNPTRGVRFKKFIDDTVEQVHRLARGLQDFPDEFNSRFNRDLSEFEIVPVIFNRLPFSYPGQYKGVYLTDSSSFERFFQSNAITFREYFGENNKNVYEYNLYQMWDGIKPTSEDLIRHFNSPIQLKIYTSGLKTTSQWLWASNDSSFTVSDVSVDRQKGIEIEFGKKLSEIRQSAVKREKKATNQTTKRKKNPKNRKRKLQGDSRKRNRTRK